MSEVAITIAAVLTLFAAALWMLFRQHGGAAHRPEHSGDPLLAPDPARMHYRYFRQVRRALSASDREYLLQRVPRAVAKRALRQRRDVAIQFVRGLHEDFSQLAQLGRTVAALSPVISREQETERMWLTLRFEALYWLVLLQLLTGLVVPLEHIESLANLVGGLGRRINEAIEALNTATAANVPVDLSA